MSKNGNKNTRADNTPSDNAEGKNLPATAQSGTEVGQVMSTELESAFGDMAALGSGLENVTSKDILIPRLTILQALSPQLDQNAPEFDEDARAGNIYDVGLQEIIGNEVNIIPVHYVKQWLEWAPRASGKGLIKIHDTDEILAQTTPDERKRPVTKDGNYIAETAQFFVLNLSSNPPLRKSFIPMASTQLKKAKRLLTLATSERLTNREGVEYVPPLFYRTYTLGTVPESNAEGRWVGWTVERGPALDQLPNWERIIMEIRNFRDALTRGDIKADIASMQSEVGTGDGHHDANGRM